MALPITRSRLNAGMTTETKGSTGFSRWISTTGYTKYRTEDRKEARGDDWQNQIPPNQFRAATDFFDLCFVGTINDVEMSRRRRTIANTTIPSRRAPILPKYFKTFRAYINMSVLPSITINPMHYRESVMH